MSIEKNAIENKLNEALHPIHLDLTDISGGCGTSYSAVIVSDMFNGKPLLQRHRLVNSVLEEELKVIHAFTMKTLTSEQWDKQKGQ